MSALPPPFLDQLREYVAEDWDDDEILDELDHRWDWFGRLYPEGPGPQESRHHGPLPLRVRRQVLVSIAEIRGGAAGLGNGLLANPKSPTDEWTNLAREKIPKISAISASLRRNHRRGASISAVAIKLEVDRGTLAGWIKRGWVSLNE